MNTIDKPIQRKEMYLSYLNGNTDVAIPEPITRIDRYLYNICMNGGGGAISGNIINIATSTISGGTRVTFTYVLEDGTQQTKSFDVMNGKDGQDGQNGQDGENGADGSDGQNGLDGKDGADGFSPVITPNADNDSETYKLDITTEDGTFTTDNLKGEKGDQGMQGIQGHQGEPGADGQQGIQGVKGDKGDDGYPFLIYRECI